MKYVYLIFYYLNKRIKETVGRVTGQNVLKARAGGRETITFPRKPELLLYNSRPAIRKARGAGTHIP